MAPSPTADATRLTESARTSPATKTPGMLASRWPRIAVQRPAARPLPVDDQVGAGEQEAAVVADQRRPPASRCAVGRR